MGKSKFETSFLRSCFECDQNQLRNPIDNTYPIWERDTSDRATVDQQQVACHIFANAVAARASFVLENGMGLFESPIERLFCMAFLIHVLNIGDDVAMQAGDSYTPIRFGSGEIVTIYPQASIGDYRVDFLIDRVDELPEPVEGKPAKEWPVKRYTSQLIVECDGHDFHEKTKEQAKRDKKRDRELQKCGYAVFHFTGSEIWNDAFKCAAEAYDGLTGKPGGK